jgi:site-specific DNA recombinase
MSKRAILYARVSGDDRNNATSSIEGQLAECRHYAEQRGYTVISEVCEDPRKQTSGADWLPELEKLLHLATTRTFDALICREVDRLARNRFKQLATEIELESHGVLVEYVVGQFADSDEGRLLKGLVSEFAEYERSKIRRRTYNGRLRSVEAGNVMTSGSTAPYGYDMAVVDGKRTLVINDREAAMVRLIFDLYITKGFGLHRIAQYLDAHKVPLPSKGNNHRKWSKSNTWSPGTIPGLLTQETYVGRWHYRKTKRIKDQATGKYRHVPRPREEWLSVTVPAIVSPEVFEAAQRRREKNKSQLGHQRKNFYALGGMVKCARCNYSMTGLTNKVNGQSYAYYYCCAKKNPKLYGVACDNIQYRVDRVEAAVWCWIKSLLLNPETLLRSIEEYQEQQRERIQPQLAMLESSQARLGELEGQKERLIAAYTAGVLSLDELASQKAALDKQIADLGQAVAALRAEAEPMLLSTEYMETIEAIAAEIRAGATLADDDKQVQRSIFQLLDVHVTLDHINKKRWADVTCTLGQRRCAVENGMSGYTMSREMQAIELK